MSVRKLLSLAWRAGLYAILLPTVLLSGPAAAQILSSSSSSYASFAIDASGSLYAWGEDQYLHTVVSVVTAQDSTPVKIAFPAGVTAWIDVAAGLHYALAVGNDGNVYAWGSNANGKLGDGTTTNSNTPVKVSLPGGVAATEVAAAQTHSLALGNDGNIYAWGYNNNGQLGDSTTTTSFSPVQVHLPAGLTPVHIYAGWYYSAALGADGSLYVWGGNAQGQLGLGNTTKQLVPVKAPFPSGVTAWTGVYCGLYFLVVLGNDGNLYASGVTGQTNYGQLGNGTTTSTTSFVKVNKPSGVSGWKAAACTGSGVLAIADNDTLYGWGYNGDGALGDGNGGTPAATNTSPVEAQLPVGVTAKAVAAGRDHALAIGSDNHLYSWGQGTQGQLGDGTFVTSYLPVIIVGVGGAGDLSLPVEVASFAAISENSSVVLHWQTQSEINNAGFNVLRKDPGASAFMTISSYTSDKALAGLGTSTTGKSYTFSDNTAQAGYSYQYEIQSVSIYGGMKNYDPISVTVSTPKRFDLGDNYPNPFNPSTTIKATLAKSGVMSLRVYNALGQLVKEVDRGYKSPGVYTYDLNMNDFASGVYFYTLKQGSNAITKKMILLK